MDGDPHLLGFSKDEDDLWPVQAEWAAVLTSAARFEQVVVASTGKMALMRTVDPRIFVTFKRWLAGRENRSEGKRRRDAHQADIVEDLMEKGLILSRR